MGRLAVPKRRHFVPIDFWSFPLFSVSYGEFQSAGVPIDFGRPETRLPGLQGAISEIGHGRHHPASLTASLLALESSGRKTTNAGTPFPYRQWSMVTQL
jgi:hypothetical protein